MVMSFPTSLLAFIELWGLTQSLITAIAIVTVIVLFLPLTAVTYYVFRRRRQELGKLRVLNLLEVDDHYKQIYGVYSQGIGMEARKLKYRQAFGELLLLSIAVCYAMAIAALGLSLLVMGDQIGFSEIPSIDVNGISFPQEGSRIVLGMAFLGAYIWGLKFLFHRYAQNDILPIVYFSLGFRMIFASLIALVAFNATDALLGGQSDSAIPLNIWPTLAFLIGMFPQRGLYWISSKLPFISSAQHPATRNAPLEMIEGLSSNDILRLDELGIENCYDLASIDFIPLILETPYSARQVVDWILQAKLCSYFGESVVDLRKYGIRHITQLASIRNEAELKAIAEETSVTFYALKMAQQSLDENRHEIERLTRVGLKLSIFTGYGVSDLTRSQQETQ